MKAPIVLVHGAWGGAWIWKRVLGPLRDAGHEVFAVTLTGDGERAHLLSPAITLRTHIDDVLGLIRAEELGRLVLVGHSYGGMVITGVADRIPGRIRRLVYLDAFVPADGESLMSLRKTGALDIEKMTRDGFVIPTWVKPDKPFPKDVPHPLKTFTDPIVLKNPAAAKIPATYILTVDKGKRPDDDDFFAASERARARGWPVIIMEGDHVVNWRQPEATAELLNGLR